MAENLSARLPIRSELNAMLSQPTEQLRCLRKVLCLDDFAPAAQRHLPRPIFGYIAGAAERNDSFKDNESVFNELGFITRTLVDVSRRTMQCTLFDKTYAAPFGIAPMGLAALSSYRGDIALAQAAQRAAIPMILSGTSLIPMEQVIAAAPSSWFQAYLPGDAARIEPLIARVAAAGFAHLVVTVDIPVSANRENNIRTGFSTPLRPSLRLALDGLQHPKWLIGTFFKTLLRQGMPHFENSFAQRGAPILSSTVMRDFSQRDHLTWDHIAQIRRQWKGVLIIKGILNLADAELAKRHGVDGLILSNHGGRQLDGAVSPMRVLEPIVEKMGALPVMIDGGFRRGSDVLKALALGARCVFLGRPFNYALAIAGEAGVCHAAHLLACEIDRNMAMLGLNRLDEVDRHSVIQKIPTSNLSK